MFVVDLQINDKYCVNVNIVYIVLVVHNSFFAAYAGLTGAVSLRKAERRLRRVVHLFTLNSCYCVKSISLNR